jgi:hypothetical protein
MRAFQGGAVTHEVEAEAGPLACLAHPGAGQPDRRHQVAARELGEHVGVDAVGLVWNGLSSCGSLGPRAPSCPAMAGHWR